MICILFLFAPVAKSDRLLAGLEPSAYIGVIDLKIGHYIRAPLRLRRFGCWWRRWGVRLLRCWCVRACGGPRDYRAGCVRACGAAGEGHQRDVASALDGYAEPTLVARADSGHAARKNLAALLHELRKDVGALVVDEVHLLDAKLADFLFAEILALAAGTSARTTRATGAAFATGTAVTAARAMSAAVTTGAVATRCASGGLRLLSWFVCHNCLPF
jgi:hypothetical protein